MTNVRIEFINRETADRFAKEIEQQHCGICYDTTRNIIDIECKNITYNAFSEQFCFTFCFTVFDWCTLERHNNIVREQDIKQVIIKPQKADKSE